METIGAIALILLVLACPLGMLAIGGVAWAVARARGEKKDFSAGCMGGHGEHQSGDSSDATTLRAENASLRREVEALRARRPDEADVGHKAETAR